MFIALCRRCGTPAAATMAFDYDLRHVWLDDLTTGSAGGNRVELCTLHADACTAPVGWELTDRRRSDDRHLFVAAEVAS